jgi:hypothetical protein
MQRSLVVNAMSLIVIKKIILFVWLITVLYRVSYTASRCSACAFAIFAMASFYFAVMKLFP